MSEFTVVVAPWYTKENPYLVKLSEQLELLGVKIEPTNCSTSSLFFLVKNKQANVLHLHWLDHFFLLRVGLFKATIKLILFISQLLILRLTNVKIFWTVHNIKNHRNQYLLLDKLGAIFVSRIAHGLIVHSETVKHEVVKTFRLSKDNKVFIIPHGNYIDVYENNINQIEARKQLNIPNSSLVLLFFGLIHPYKGLLELIKAFKQLNHNEIYLLIAGKPCNDVMGTQLNQEIEANRNIKFIPGFVAEEKVQIYMNACDVVALPYREFLTSGAVILAMSFGKACVAPNKGFVKEVLDDKGGFLYDPDSEEGLLQALTSVVHKQNVLSYMGQHNYNLASQWNWNYIAKLTLNVYQH